MIRRVLGVAGLCAVVAATAACQSDRLVFTTYTKVGLDVATTNGMPTSAVLGYKRFEGAIIPVEEPETGGTPKEAASVLAAIDMKNRWFGGLDIIQAFATGEAAADLSRDPHRGLDSLLKSMHEKVVGDKQQEAQ